MRKLLGMLTGSLSLFSCGNTPARPRFSGPVIKPLWHNSDIRVSDTPLIRDGVVYVQARPWSEDKKQLYAFDLKTGKALPATALPGPPQVTGGGMRYVLNTESNTKVQAFDLHSNTMRWQWETTNHPASYLAADEAGPYVSVQGTDSASVIALDAHTGKVNWTHKTARYFPEGPVVLTPETVVVRDLPPGKNAARWDTGYVFRGLNRATGSKLWEATTSWKYEHWIEKDGVLYVSDRNDHALVDEGGHTSPDSWVTAVDLRTGRELWRSEMVQLATFTLPAAAEGVVVVGSESFGSAKPEVSGLWAYEIPR